MRTADPGQASSSEMIFFKPEELPGSEWAGVRAGVRAVILLLLLVVLTHSNTEVPLKNPFLHQILPPAFSPALTRSLSTARAPFTQELQEKHSQTRVCPASALVLLSTSPLLHCNTIKQIPPEEFN